MDDMTQVPGRAQTIETRKETPLLPPQPVECACGCGTYFEDEMYYYVIADVYVRTQNCADKFFKIRRYELNRWFNGSKL
jgi:hypothetical protein